jgi:hypothetical protein
MVLAVHELSLTAQAVCYGIAVGAFILAAVSGVVTKLSNPPGLALVALGLAAYAFPTFWHALAVS